MSHHSLLLLAASLLPGLFGTLALAQTPATTVPAMPQDTKPIRVAGLGIRVSDLERSKKFYTEILGLKVFLSLEDLTIYKNIYSVLESRFLA